VTEASFALQFRKARRQRKLTQVGAAKALGVSQSAIAQWESGRNYPAEELGPKIEKVFGVRAESTAQAAARRLPAARPRLPIIGIPAPADEELVLVDDVPHGDIVAPPQLESVSGARAVYVRGHAMEPRYYPGEVVYLRPDRPANPGDFVFVTARDRAFATPVGFIRQYLRQDLVHIHLATLNPKREHLFAKDDIVAMTVIVGSGLL
jgi:transcriptional regulator with XRE-family HTH domain